MNANTTSNAKQDAATAGMQKRVTVKEDGRLLIYYTFDRQTSAKPDQKQDKAAQR